MLKIGYVRSSSDAVQMRSVELKCMQMLDEKCSVTKWWMPLIWATNIIDTAREENRIRLRAFQCLDNTYNSLSSHRLLKV